MNEKLQNRKKVIQKFAIETLFLQLDRSTSIEYQRHKIETIATLVRTESKHAVRGRMDSSVSDHNFKLNSYSYSSTAQHVWVGEV